MSLLFWWHGIADDVAAPVIPDQPGRAIVEFTRRIVRSDLTDPDGIVSVQSIVFTAPDGTTQTSVASERTNARGTWRASIRNSSGRFQQWTATWVYTDVLGRNKMAVARATRP